MLDIANTRVFQMTEEAVHSADIANVQNGQGLVYKNEAGIGKVGLVSAAGQKFAGVAMAGYVRPSTLTQTDEFMPTADAKEFALSYMPAGGAVEVFNVTEGKAMADGFTFDAESNKITFDEGGFVAHVTYRIEATLSQAREATGDGYPAGYQIAQLNGTVGVIAQGEISTDMFDVGSDFTADAPIYVDANGYFTMSAEGNVEVPNARVLAAPGVASQFLRIKLV
jgi:hypothetical protein